MRSNQQPVPKEENTMKKVLMLVLASLFVFVVASGCGDDDDDSGGGTVCDQAAEIQMNAMEEACGDYDECCMCDCLLEGSSDIEGCDCGTSDADADGDADCSGEIEEAAQACVDDEAACADDAAALVDLACSI
jgi:hypothetical protein